MQTILQGSFQFAESDEHWSLWDGERLGSMIALDTETTLITGKGQIPDLCLVAVSNEKNHFVLKPEQLPLFLQTNISDDVQLIFHNVAFDFWVVDKFLSSRKDVLSRSLLWTAVDQHRVHDTMLLGTLTSLAESDSDVISSLSSACKTHLGVELQKDQYRLDFDNLLNKPWDEIDQGFFEYAVTDAFATWRLYECLATKAISICNLHDLPLDYGYLSEGIQVKGAIGLSNISRRGMTIDIARLEKLRAEISSSIDRLVFELNKSLPSLFKLSQKNGEVQFCKKTGLPQYDMLVLKAHLANVAEKHGLIVPKTERGHITTSFNDYWGQFSHLDPVLNSISSLNAKRKMHSFLEGMNQPTIHPNYKTLKRTGRTSCSGPNIQQLPRDSSIREVVTAKPGHVLFVIDYNCLELRTLAYVCQSKYGRSRLAEVLKSGQDPHSYTAAMFHNIEASSFSSHENRKQLRQHAKAFNFGIPAGLGAKSIVEYAKTQYGVTVTLEEAERFKTQLTRVVYPELAHYLSQDDRKLLATVLRSTEIELRAIWPDDFNIIMLKKILSGNPVKADGKPYNPHAVNRIWTELRVLCRNTEYQPFIQDRDISPSSPLTRIFNTPANTTTGRMRGAVSYTQTRNTPFQGLAADGCKEALWELTKAGYRVVGFVHDEFVIEIPRAGDYSRVAQDINRICCESMESLIPGIPVKCEFAVMERWSKKAEAVYDGQGKLVLWKGA
jgi:DNA polymerase I-like protein with 3'-5' exonuclease and polymerase domains